MKKSTIFEWITLISFIFLSYIYMSSDVSDYINDTRWVRFVFIIIIVIFLHSMKTWIVELIRESSDENKG